MEIVGPPLVDRAEISAMDINPKAIRLGELAS